MLVLEWKDRTFIEKLNSRCFCWFPAAILVHQNGAPIWRLHAKLYKGAWNVSANNSEIVGHKDLRLGQIVYILIFYTISFSWLLPLDSFQFNFLLPNSENDLFLWSTDLWHHIRLQRYCYQDGRPMLFGFFVIVTHRLTELCILNAENVEKVYSRPFKQMSWLNKEDLELF